MSRRASTIGDRSPGTMPDGQTESDMGQYEPRKSDRFGFGLWTIMNTGRDPFGEPTRGPMGGLEAITELGKRNVYAYEMHFEDIIPDGTSAAERDRIVKEAAKRMADAEIVCGCSGANTFTHPVFKDGALTSHDPKIRQLALRKYLTAIDVGHELGCRLTNIWWGRDGAEVDAAKDPIEAIKRLREAFNYLQAHIDRQKYEGYRLSIEPKPNEPRGDTYLPTVGHAMALIATLNKPENCGLVPEVAHVRMAGLNAYHEIALAIESNKLYGVHLNSQKPLRYDQDLRFGAEDLKESFFIVKLLEDNKWAGNKSFDAHAYRTADREEVWDFVAGCMRTYLILREKVKRFNEDAEVQGLLKDLRQGPSVPPPAPAEVLCANIDSDALARRKYHHEKLDQLLQELLMGVR
jgi:xylose isomerase